MDDKDKNLIKVIDTLGLNNEDAEPETELLIQDFSKPEDIEDITEKNNKRILTNQDYLILTDLSSNKGIETLSIHYDVTKNYIKKLMRSDSGSEFLNNVSAKKSETALAVSTSAVADGVLRYQQMINELFDKGQTNLALQYLFGKMSLSEVQAMLHKQHMGQESSDGDKLIDLFSSLTVGNSDAK